jgi:hypothetical protein
MENIKSSKVWVARSGKRPAGKYAQWKEDPYYSSFDEAYNYDYYGVDGVGLITVVPLAAIDLDKCFLDDGHLHPDALKILDQCKDTYAERSISGKGVHIFGYYYGAHRGQVSTNPEVKDEIGYGVELFQQVHHVTVSFVKSDQHANKVSDFTQLFDTLWSKIESANGTKPQQEKPFWRQVVSRRVDSIDFTVADVWPSVLDGPKSGGNILSVCPSCGKRSHGGDNNFSYNPQKDRWMCFQDSRSSGNALTALAVDEGLIKCKDAGRVSLKGIGLSKVIKERFGDSR